MTIAQAKASAGINDVWVMGYIVGGDLSNSSGSFEGPFTADSNLILGPKSTTTNRSSCLAIQLPSGKIRDELNLVSNPELLGKKVCLKGDVVESYFGLVGMKSLSEYIFE